MDGFGVQDDLPTSSPSHPRWRVLLITIPTFLFRCYMNTNKALQRQRYYTPTVPFVKFDMASPMKGSYVQV